MIPRIILPAPGKNRDRPLAGARGSVQSICCRAANARERLLPPLLGAFLLTGMLCAQTPEYGPEKGTLVIQGGGDPEGTGILETFINKAGGPDAKIVVVPTAA